MFYLVNFRTVNLLNREYSQGKKKFQKVSLGFPIHARDRGVQLSNKDYSIQDKSKTILVQNLKIKYTL